MKLEYIRMTFISLTFILYWDLRKKLAQKSAQSLSFIDEFKLIIGVVGRKKLRLMDKRTKIQYALQLLLFYSSHFIVIYVAYKKRFQN